MLNKSEAQVIEVLTIDQKLDIALESLVQLTGLVEGLQEQNLELIERINNMSLPGTDFSVDDDNYMN